MEVINSLVVILMVLAIISLLIIGLFFYLRKREWTSNIFLGFIFGALIGFAIDILFWVILLVLANIFESYTNTIMNSFFPDENGMIIGIIAVHSVWIVSLLSAIIGMIKSIRKR